MTDLRTSIADALNKASAENASNTPDFILAEYLIRCLDNFDRTVRNRDSWYGINPSPGSSPATPAGDPAGRCSVCGEPQWQNQSGTICLRGHGGAPALLPGEIHKETS